MRKPGFAALLLSVSLTTVAVEDAERRLTAAAIAALEAALHHGAPIDPACRLVGLAIGEVVLQCRRDAVAAARHQCWAARALTERGAPGARVEMELASAVDWLLMLRLREGCPKEPGAQSVTVGRGAAGSRSGAPAAERSAEAL